METIVSLLVAVASIGGFVIGYYMEKHGKNLPDFFWPARLFALWHNNLNPTRTRPKALSKLY